MSSVSSYKLVSKLSESERQKNEKNREERVGVGDKIGKVRRAFGEREV